MNNFNFVNSPFSRGQARAQRDGGFRSPRNVRAHYIASPFGRSGKPNGSVVYDEAAFYADPRQMYTELDKTVKKYTVGQAYAQAAMVIRAKRGLSPDTPVFPKGTYDGRNDQPALTLVEFSDLVEDLIFNR